MTSKISDLIKIKKNLAFYNEMKGGDYYIFTGKNEPWSGNEDSPTFTIPIPSMDSFSLQEELRDIIALKKIQPFDVSLGIRRYNWEYGHVYDPYDYRDENLLRKQYYDGTHPFYVLTDTFDVYKCLDNAGGSLSTIKPQQILYTPFTLGDGYTWKYMFTVPEETRLKFLSDFYIPVQDNSELISNSSQQLVSAAATKGTIDTVTITNPGVNYSLLDTTIEISDSDRSSYLPTSVGFAASLQISDIDGSLTKVVVTNPGINYSNRTVLTISSGSGTDATIIPQISPWDGHGYNAALELGAFYTLVSVKLDNEDLEFFPDTITYRKVGIITDHVQYSLSDQYSESYYYGPKHNQFLNSTLRQSNPELFIYEGIGSILYINYISKITRAINQKETIRFVLETV